MIYLFYFLSSGALTTYRESLPGLKQWSFPWVIEMPAPLLILWKPSSVTNSVVLYICWETALHGTSACFESAAVLDYLFEDICIATAL